MTNLELAEQIKANLNELIDVRGNTQLIPALIEVQRFIDEIHSLHARLARLEELTMERELGISSEITDDLARSAVEADEALVAGTTQSMDTVLSEMCAQDLQRMAEAYLTALVVIRNPGLSVVLYSRWVAMEDRAKDIVRRKAHA